MVSIIISPLLTISFNVKSSVVGILSVCTSPHGVMTRLSCLSLHDSKRPTTPRINNTVLFNAAAKVQQ
jgi:hypothetical protein